MQEIAPALETEAQELISVHGRRVMQILVDRAVQLIRDDAAEEALQTLGQLIVVVDILLIEDGLRQAAAGQK